MQETKTTWEDVFDYIEDTKRWIESIEENENKNTIFIGGSQ